MLRIHLLHCAAEAEVRGLYSEVRLVLYVNIRQLNMKIFLLVIVLHCVRFVFFLFLDRSYFCLLSLLFCTVFFYLSIWQVQLICFKWFVSNVQKILTKHDSWFETKIYILNIRNENSFYYELQILVDTMPYFTWLSTQSQVGF